MEVNFEEINNLPVEEKVEKLLEIAQQATAKAQEKEEYAKKLESAQESWLQKLIDESKYNNLLRDEKNKLNKDKDYMIELAEKDEVLAQAVLDEYFPWMTIEEALKQVSPDAVVAKKTIKPERSVEDQIEEGIAKREIAKQKKDYLDKLNLSEDEKQLFEQEFADLTEWKKLSEANITKYLRFAFKEAVPQREDLKKIEKDAYEMSMWQGGSMGKSSTNQHNALSDNISYLKEQGILK